jgi:chorismate mutase/prephenate dehydratase
MNLLEEARIEINAVDAEMAKLFERRMRAAEKVAAYKKEMGLPILDPAREAKVIERGASMIEDEVLRGYYIQFLKSNMAISRAYQGRILEGMRVAYSGTEGAFAHIATTKLFPNAQKIPFPDFEKAYRAVENGECDACVLPVENSSNGEVGQVTDLLFSGLLYANRMFELAVSQDLLVCPGATLADIKTVISHPQALGQCSDYIASHGFETKEFSNTALAAKWVAEHGDTSVAAIASAEAADIFGLKVLETNINKSRNNTTKFVVLTPTYHKHTSSDMGLHSILMFTVRNEAGALAKAVDVIGRHGFNMKALRSRPMKELLWQYYFYVEAEGDIESEEGRQMLRVLEMYCDRLKVLGTYIKGE